MKVSEIYNRDLEENQQNVELCYQPEVNCPPGDIWQYLETFLAVTTAGMEVLLVSSG